MEKVRRKIVSQTHGDKILKEASASGHTSVPRLVAGRLFRQRLQRHFPRRQAGLSVVTLFGDIY